MTNHSTAAVRRRKRWCHIQILFSLWSLLNRHRKDDAPAPGVPIIVKGYPFLDV